MRGRGASRIGAMAACLAVLAGGQAIAAEAIKSPGAAIEAAKKYVKGRCTASPCKYRAQRDGPQWRVWVDLPAQGKTPGGHIVLYFDREGNLIRRLEGD